MTVRRAIAVTNKDGIGLDLAGLYAGIVPVGSWDKQDWCCACEQMAAILMGWADSVEGA